MLKCFQVSEITTSRKLTAAQADKYLPKDVSAEQERCFALAGADLRMHSLRHPAASSVADNKLAPSRSSPAWFSLSYRPEVS